MTRRFWVGVVLSVPLLVMAMAEHVVPAGIGADAARRDLGAARARHAGRAVVRRAVFRRGWQSLVNRHLNMFTLIALGTGVAYLYSLVATLLPGIFPASFRGPEGGVPVYFEAAAVIVTLVLLGQVLELRARSQTSSAIRALLDLAPKRARLVEPDGSERGCRSRLGPARADSCASGPAKRCRSTASSSRAAAPSMNR